MMNNLGLTDAEYFRIHGTLPADRIEDMLHLGTAANELKGAQAHIQEARAQYPDEDFLSDVESDLQDIIRSTRGATRDRLKALAAKLEDIAQTTFYASDYGRDELRKLDKLLEAL